MEEKPKRSFEAGQEVFVEGRDGKVYKAEVINVERGGIVFGFSRSHTELDTKDQVVILPPDEEERGLGVVDSLELRVFTDKGPQRWLRDSKDGSFEGVYDVVEG